MRLIYTKDVSANRQRTFLYDLQCRPAWLNCTWALSVINEKGLVGPKPSLNQLNQLCVSKWEGLCLYLWICGDVYNQVNRTRKFSFSQRWKRGQQRKNRTERRRNRGDTNSWLRFQCMTVQVWIDICLFFYQRGMWKVSSLCSTSKHDCMMTSSGVHNASVYRTMRGAVTDIIAYNSCI